MKTYLTLTDGKKSFEWNKKLSKMGLLGLRKPCSNKQSSVNRENASASVNREMTVNTKIKNFRNG